MEIKKRLISLMLAASISVGAATMAGCGDVKTKEELNCENEIRKMLQYDANINIRKDLIDTHGFHMFFKIEENSRFLIAIRYYFASGVLGNTYQEITYSVDKDFYYNFKEEYSTKETQKDVDLIKELTTKYDPIKVGDETFEKEYNK